MKKLKNPNSIHDWHDFCSTNFAEFLVENLGSFQEIWFFSVNDVFPSCLENLQTFQYCKIEKKKLCSPIELSYAGNN